MTHIQTTDTLLYDTDINIRLRRNKGDGPQMPAYYRMYIKLIILIWIKIVLSVLIAFISMAHFFTFMIYTVLIEMTRHHGHTIGWTLTRHLILYSTLKILILGYKPYAR